MNEVRCASCKVRVGITPASALRTRVYCSEWCSNEPAVSHNEERDDLIVSLALSGDPFTVSYLAEMFELSRPRVHGIISTRLGLSSVASLASAVQVT